MSIFSAIASHWLRRALLQSTVAMTAIGGGAGEVTNYIDLSDVPPAPVIVDLRDQLPSNGHYPLRARTPETLVIHHTATRNQGWGTVAQFHVQANGWKAIGYAYGTSWDGKWFVLNDPDRRQNQTRNHNSSTVGLAMLGNFHVQPIGEAQLKATKDYSLFLQRTRGYKYIRPHRDLVSTACPGNFAVQQLEDLWVRP